MDKKKVPECCAECAIWEIHKDKCWYYWEYKKNCTMHSRKQGSF